MPKNASENLERIFKFLHQAESLKSTLRYSSTKTGRTESTAEHSWRLALMAFIMADELKLNINLERAIKIALLHDIAEAITGDIDALEVAEGKVSKQEKQKLETVAMKRLKAMLPPDIGNEIYNLWGEYGRASTKEAKFVKVMDKIETLTQLAEAGYKTYDHPKFIQSYADEVYQYVVEDFPELASPLKIVKRKLKAEFNKGGFFWSEK